ncbi:MAG: hypothetical protein U0525_03550 [Patescibacteria group bacterium]
MLIGKVLEARQKQTSSAVEALVSLQPKTARAEREGKAIDIPIDEVQKGRSSDRSKMVRKRQLTEIL